MLDIRYIHKFMTGETFADFLDAYMEYWLIKDIIIIRERLTQADLNGLQWDFANTMAVKEGRQPLEFKIRKKKASTVEKVETHIQKIKQEPKFSSASETEPEKEDEKDRLSTHAQETFSEDEGKGESSISSKSTVQEMTISCKTELTTKREIIMPTDVGSSSELSLEKRSSTENEKSLKSTSIETREDAVQKLKLSVSEWQQFEIRRFLNYPDVNVNQQQNREYKEHILTNLIKGYKISYCKLHPLSLMQKFSVNKEHIAKCTNIRFNYLRNVLRSTPREQKIIFPKQLKLAPSELVNNENVLWMTGNLGYAVNRVHIIKNMIIACIENLGIEKRQWEENTQGWVYKQNEEKIKLEVGPIYDEAFHHALAFLSEIEQIQNVKLNHCDILYDIARGNLNPANEEKVTIEDVSPAIRAIVKLV
jgi:hypothetical protein